VDLLPPAGSPEELQIFSALGDQLPVLYRRLVDNPRSAHTVVVVPSLSLDRRELSKISGVHHYEERLLFHLMLLRHPRVRLLYVTSQALDPTVIDYYLHLLAGVPSAHARERLLLIHTADASSMPLSEKILRRPRVVERIRRALGDRAMAHMVCFNATTLERSLAVQLGIPLYACDPALAHLGSKSGCREIFRQAGVLLPDGFENLTQRREIAEALSELKGRDPALKRAVVKLNEGFSGEGNAIYHYECASDASVNSIEANLHKLQFTAPQETWEAFEDKFADMQGVVEAFVEGDNKRSPSAQCRVNAVGQAQIISTHDQVLGGDTGQVFEGCTFPADDVYRTEIQRSGLEVAQALAAKGVIGRFAVDYVSIPDGTGWKHYAIEVNLRKGGTTHPFLTLKFLTDGTYDTDSGLFRSASGQAKYYFASDTLQSERYVGLMPEDLIDIAVYNGLHFDATTERGVVFHLIGALSEFGKLGLVCIGDNPQQAQFLYRQAQSVLSSEVQDRSITAPDRRAT
jgi:hypothetical protein